jgi:hypothetical protein
MVGWSFMDHFIISMFKVLASSIILGPGKCRASRLFLLIHYRESTTEYEQNMDKNNERLIPLPHILSVNTNCC